MNYFLSFFKNAIILQTNDIRRLAEPEAAFEFNASDDSSEEQPCLIGNEGGFLRYEASKVPWPFSFLTEGGR